MVAPLAPHVAEELWRRLGHDDDDHLRRRSPSPTRRCSSTTPSSTRCRSTARCAATSRSPPTPTPATVEAAALADAKVAAAIDGATPKKVIVVPGRMVNVVV